MEKFPENWRRYLSGMPELAELDLILQKVENERASGVTVYPPSGRIFRAFELTPPEAVRVVLLGQDPYHGENQAEGLAFSVPRGVKAPPSLCNIGREFSADLGCPPPGPGDLEAWAAAGVLLLNSVLSVRAGVAGSHRKLNWEKFTDGVIRTLGERKSGLVFLLWGNFAMAKTSLIDRNKHTLLESAHPSPLSAYRGFFGSRPFSRTEAALENFFWPRPETLL